MRQIDMALRPLSHKMLWCISALVFMASVILTIHWCTLMSALSDIVMPGGWTLSALWVRMPEQTWAGVAISFLRMWTVMMVAMMLPALILKLQYYQESIGRTNSMRLGLLTAMVGSGYFFVWVLFGMLIFPLGLVLATIEMQQPGLARAVPVIGGAIILAIGFTQFTPWKAQHLACWQRMGKQDHNFPANGAMAWRQGMRLGFHCLYCCGGMMVILLIIGIMNLAAMVFITVAMTLELSVITCKHLERTIGIVIISIGLAMILTHAWH